MKGQGHWWAQRLRPWLWRYGTPALLCSVALLQQYQAHARGLSPWKGGGFGMFSTVDAPSARFLRLALITDSGEISVAVPEELRGPAQRLRTLPDAVAAQRFAGRLADFTWVAPDLGTVRVISTSKADVPRDSSEPVDDDLQIGGSSGSLELTPVILPITRGEPVPDNLSPIKVSVIRVELWRYEFRLDPLGLEAERLLQIKERL